MAEAWTVTWQRHPGTGKWHAYLPDQTWSICHYTNQGSGDRVPTLPEGARPCLVCRAYAPRRFRPPTPPNKAEVEEMLVEFIGGPYVGTRFKAKVMVESATQFQ